jgi:hypothetical protein
MEKNKLYKLDFSKLSINGEIRGHYAILKGDLGIVVTDDECYHSFPNERGMFHFEVYPFPVVNIHGDKKISMTPSHVIKFNDHELKIVTTEEIVDISKWINYFGVKSRIKSNYDLFKNTCKEIGSTIVLPKWK